MSGFLSLENQERTTKNDIKKAKNKKNKKIKKQKQKQNKTKVKRLISCR